MTNEKDEPADEWTFVSRSSKKKKGGNRKRAGLARGRCSIGGGGGSKSNGAAAAGAVPSSFYGTSSGAKKQTDGAGTELGDEEQNGGSGSFDANTDEGRSRLERLRRRVLGCMDALDGHPFVSNLLDSIRRVPRHEEEESSDILGGRANAHHVREIVCYGIGSFGSDRGASSSAAASEDSSSSFAYSAPMLQLACALVLRRSLARDAAGADGANAANAAADDDDRQSPSAAASASPESAPLPVNSAGDNADDSQFEADQRNVRMLYFEPLMTPVERSLLEDALRVEIIETNERGKRRVSSGPDHRTLFYMPHCPMRLYSNVLHANWDPPELLADGNVIIFGNDLEAYDDRTVSEEERSDPTNAVFRILPHLVSVRVGGLGGGKGKSRGRIDDERNGAALGKMEVAFNDCNVTWFARERVKGPNGAGKDVTVAGEASDKPFDDVPSWPARPAEHFFKDDLASGRDREVI